MNTSYCMGLFILKITSKPNRVLYIISIHVGNQKGVF